VPAGARRHVRPDRRVFRVRHGHVHRDDRCRGVCAAAARWPVARVRDARLPCYTGHFSGAGRPAARAARDAQPMQAIAGTLVVAAGLPVYSLLQRQKPH
jgi:hypothetical protein